MIQTSSDVHWYSIDAPLLAAGVSLLVTLIISALAFRTARRIERRRIVLDFLRELNSLEVMRDRRNTVIAIENFSKTSSGRQQFEDEVWSFLIDSANLDWSPGCGKHHFGVGRDGSKVSAWASRRQYAAADGEAQFVRNHGLANFIYFVARIQICCDKNLLDRRLADAFLYSWCLHYYPFLSHFVVELRKQLENRELKHGNLQSGWIAGLEAAVKRMAELGRLELPSSPDSGRSLRWSGDVQISLRSFWPFIRVQWFPQPVKLHPQVESAAPTQSSSGMLPIPE